MKLQRHFAYTYKGKKHYKNVITIPDNIVNQLNWNIGDEIEMIVQGDSLQLKATPTPISKPIAIAKDPYEDFRDEVEKVLQSHPNGISWSQIKKQLQLSQRTPYHKWVRRMEKDIGLVREKKGTKTIWRLGK
jgi:antitoxin component of MazEF toxin-antitoxin module